MTVSVTSNVIVDILVGQAVVEHVADGVVVGGPVGGNDVEDVVIAVGGTVPKEGVGRQVVTCNPSRKAARPSGWRGSLKPGGRLPTIAKYKLLAQSTMLLVVER